MMRGRGDSICANIVVCNAAPKCGQSAKICIMWMPGYTELFSTISFVFLHNTLTYIIQVYGSNIFLDILTLLTFFIITIFVRFGVFLPSSVPDG